MIAAPRHPRFLHGVDDPARQHDDALRSHRPVPQQCARRLCRAHMYRPRLRGERGPDPAAKTPRPGPRASACSTVCRRQQRPAPSGCAAGSPVVITDHRDMRDWLRPDSSRSGRVRTTSGRQSGAPLPAAIGSVARPATSAARSRRRRRPPPVPLFPLLGDDSSVWLKPTAKSLDRRCRHQDSVRRTVVAEGSRPPRPRLVLRRRRASPPRLPWSTRRASSGTTCEACDAGRSHAPPVKPAARLVLSLLVPQSARSGPSLPRSTAAYASLARASG